MKLCESVRNTMDQRCMINVILNQTRASTMFLCWTVCPKPVLPVHLGWSSGRLGWKTFPFNLWTVQPNCPKTRVSEVNARENLNTMSDPFTRNTWSLVSSLSKTKFDCTALVCPRLKSNKVDFFLSTHPARAEQPRERKAWERVRPLHPEGEPA